MIEEWVHDRLIDFGDGQPTYTIHRMSRLWVDHDLRSQSSQSVRKCDREPLLDGRICININGGATFDDSWCLSVVTFKSAKIKRTKKQCCSSNGWNHMSQKVEVWWCMVEAPGAKKPGHQSLALALGASSGRNSLVPYVVLRTVTVEQIQYCNRYRGTSTWIGKYLPRGTSV